MVKRVALREGIGPEPELLFLTSLPPADPDRSENFVRLIQQLQRELGSLPSMVTHDLGYLGRSGD